MISGINENTLYCYKRRFVKGLNMHKENGRPPALDAEAQSELKVFLRSDPSRCMSDIQAYVKEKQAETWQRRVAIHGTLATSEMRVICRRTVLLYVKKYKVMEASSL
jgi:transposase